MYEDNEYNYWQEEFELYGFSDEEIAEIWDSYDDQCVLKLLPSDTEDVFECNTPNRK